MELRKAEDIAKQLIEVGFASITITVTGDRSNGLAYKAKVQVSITALTAQKLRALLDTVDEGAEHASFDIGDGVLLVELT